MVATGASAAVPPVPGLKDTPHLTNSNFWNLEDMPPRMGVIGAGPIGLEMSQAMQRFGCKVMDVRVLMSTNLEPPSQQEAELGMR